MKIKNVLTAGVIATAISFAGGNIVPTTQSVSVPDSGFYVTGKIGSGQSFNSGEWNYFDDGNGINNDVYSMIGLGFGYRYSINSNWFIDSELGVYTTADSTYLDRTDYELSVRPGYRITQDWDIYGILGADYVSIREKSIGYHEKDWTPQVGLGVGYNLNTDLKATVEYTYNTNDFKDQDFKNDKVVVGLRYSF